MKTLSLTFLALTFGIFFNPGASLKAQSTDPMAGIEVFAIMQPDSISFDSLKKFSFQVGARNKGKVAKNPHFTATRLEINGKPNMAWDQVVDQGKRPPAWTKLEPGKSIALEFGSVGYYFFRKPGTYELKFYHFQKEIMTHTIMVTE